MNQPPTPREEYLSAVSADRRLSAAHRLVARILAYFSDPELRRLVYPSALTIAERSGLSIRTVRRALKRLKETGHLPRVERRHGAAGRQATSVYHLAPECHDVTLARVTSTPVQSDIHGPRAPHQSDSLSPDPDPDPEIQDRSRSLVGLAPDPVPRERTRRNQEAASRVLARLNALCGRDYQAKGASLDLVLARLGDAKDPIPEADLVAVVEYQHREWAGDVKMRQYLRPSTLFARANCAMYRAAALQVRREEHATSTPKLCRRCQKTLKGNTIEGCHMECYR